MPGANRWNPKSVAEQLGISSSLSTSEEEKPSLGNDNTLPDEQTANMRMEASMSENFSEHSVSPDTLFELYGYKDKYYLDDDFIEYCVKAYSDRKQVGPLSDDISASLIEQGIPMEAGASLCKQGLSIGTGFSSERGRPDADDLSSEDSLIDLTVSSEDSSLSSLSSLAPGEFEYLQVSSTSESQSSCGQAVGEDTRSSSSLSQSMASQLHRTDNSLSLSISTNLHRIGNLEGTATHDAELPMAGQTGMENMVYIESGDPVPIPPQNEISGAIERLGIYSAGSSPSPKKIGHTGTQITRPSPLEMSQEMMDIAHRLLSLKCSPLIDWCNPVWYTPEVFAPRLLWIPEEEEAEDYTFDISLPFWPLDD